MKLDKDMKLADLMYGHGSKFICSLSGRFNPEKYPDASPIQICEMKCGCFIVADGNNRVGLILKKNPEATIAEIPERLLATARFGEWDAEMMDWWNPCAKSFREVVVLHREWLVVAIRKLTQNNRPRCLHRVLLVLALRHFPNLNSGLALALNPGLLHHQAPRRDRLI
jgi:hypothetical protein